MYEFLKTHWKLRIFSHSSLHQFCLMDSLHLRVRGLARSSWNVSFLRNKCRRERFLLTSWPFPCLSLQNEQVEDFMLLQYFSARVEQEDSTSCWTHDTSSGIVGLNGVLWMWVSRLGRSLTITVYSHFFGERSQDKASGWSHSLLIKHSVV